MAPSATAPAPLPQRSLLGSGVTEIFTFGGQTTCATGVAFCDWDLASFDLGDLSGITGIVIEGTDVLIDNLTLGSLDPSTRPDPNVPPIPEPGMTRSAPSSPSRAGSATRPIDSDSPAPTCTAISPPSFT